MIKRIVTGILVGFTLVASSAVAADSIATAKIRIVVNRSASVRGNEITLGEIGAISSEDPSATELAAKLKSLVISAAPPAGGSVQIMGQRVIDAMSAADINLESVLFSIPPVVVVQREGRHLTTEEVLAAAQEKTSPGGKPTDLRVNAIGWDQEQTIPLGQTKIAVEALGQPAAGKLPMRISVSVDAQPVTKFLATAEVDDWRAVPVLNKTIERGMLISEADFELVRANMAQLASDVASRPEDLLGHAAKSRIPAGETVRRSMIDIPPIITKGSKITARYALGGLTATALVVAAEDGLPGGSIKVRNESSNKIFRADVIDEKTVEVK